MSRSSRLSTRMLLWAKSCCVRDVALGSRPRNAHMVEPAQSKRTNSQACAGGASKGGLGTRALLWAVGCCVRCVVLEVDGLACVLSQAGEPGPAAPPGAGGRGAPGSPSDPEARDAIVLEVRRIALLPCAGAASRPVQALACGVQGCRMWAFCWRSITCRPLS